MISAEPFVVDPFSPDLLWIVIVGFVIAFADAFALGANDVANSFGTSVGSKVLTIRNACIIATVAEVSGAILIGSKVTDTMRKGILDISMYEGDEKELMLGCLASLVGSSVWVTMATLVRLPVSATHSSVGAAVGFSLVARGAEGLHWDKVIQIAISWVVSPVLAGVISTALYVVINKFVLKSNNPMVRGLLALPFIYGLTVLINVFSVVHDGPPMLYFDKLSWWVALLISLGVAIIVGVLVHFFLSPYLKKKCLDINLKEHVQGTAAYDNNGFARTENNSNSSMVTKEHVISVGPLNGVVDCGIDISSSPTQCTDNTTDMERGQSLRSRRSDTSSKIESEKAKSGGIHSARDDDPPEIVILFTFLQIMTATFTSFVHGGNDVSNAIGPITAIWLIYQQGTVSQKVDTPLYILAFGGLGISVGLWVLGRKVMKTIGSDLSKIVPSTGFVIELGAATTVLIASKIGLPISTTHCLVGSVVIVGRVTSSKEGVNWKLFRNIIFAWLVTLPMAGGISALVMFILREVAL